MLISEALFGVVDVETTGLDPAVDRVVECAIVGCCQLRNLSDTSKAAWSALFSPGISIPPAASAIHHLTDEDVQGCEDFKTAEVDEFDIYAAHNAEFESKFIPQIKAKPIICTMRMAKKLWPTLDSFSNQFLRYQLKLNIPAHIKSRSMHRAFPDAYVTAVLLQAELDELEKVKPQIKTVEELVQWLAKPTLLYRCNFGKHGPKDGKPGLLWSEVPTNYLDWMNKNMTDMDADLAFTVRHYLGK